ncbi:MAG TPA: adenylate/guanylate cyclase domain-containing protein [Candidatus Wallbacteria bacterium]|nr:MAG: Adenylate cyclase [bacterium ADurb.Bin243]HPG59841.1 adenylate/guanylate cyclase domain-containing protein [Candidatus Wallbacteria bacterium]
MENKNLTIMFTDIKGFTQRTSLQSRIATAELIKQHNDLLAPIFEERGGKIIKTIGDAFLVVFESPTNAVLTGIQLQQKLKEHNGNTAETDRLEVRVAISTGEVSVIDNDIYGEAVNIAARLESVSEANEVYFTESTYLAMNRSEVPTAEIGYRLFKGIPDKIKIFKVLREGHEAKPGPGRSLREANQQAIPDTANIKTNVAEPVKEFGFVIVPICMFLFGALGRVFLKSGEGFILGLGAGFLFRCLEMRKNGRRPGATAFAAGFFLALSLGLIFRIKAAAGLLAIAFGLLLMTYFKRF